MQKIEYSIMALEDLESIKEKISLNNGNNTALKVLRKIIKDIKVLELFPFSGVNLGKLIDVSTDYRYIFIEKNYVFYRVENDKVKIIRIINERQDYIIQLFNN
ncbi:MAG: type II toxin-antitoxin system RelE/ParE family toxin [Clostridia bacterium]|nr:type II toxin-antitoxin system RelE/ParE family toxin [Clostridia bacterium]